MTTLLLIVWLLLAVGLVLLLALWPRRTTHSRFELNRLHDETTLRRERLLGGLLALRRVAIMLFAMANAMAAVVLFGGWSPLAVLVVLLISAPLARISWVRRASEQLYQAHEQRLLRFVEKNSWTGWFMLPGDKTPHDQRLESPEQLLHLAESSSVLSPDQLTIVRHGLTWHTATVASIMVPKERVASIKHRELLGPLVLDDLHKTGHSRFPVIKGSLDEVIGMLDITELLEVTARHTSPTAGKAMSPRVLRIESDEPLPVALAMLQKSHMHLLIVVDKTGKTVGLLTLADITASLLGKTGVE